MARLASAVRQFAVAIPLVLAAFDPPAAWGADAVDPAASRAAVEALASEVNPWDSTPQPPAGPRAAVPLFISMHGGGGGPPQMNTSQWQNQQRLYQPADAIYLAPRAPTDTWDLWHQAHIDRFFDRLIADLVVIEGVDPNRVYLLGYSAGGDGVHQVAPRMADRELFRGPAPTLGGHDRRNTPGTLRSQRCLHRRGDGQPVRLTAARMSFKPARRGTFP